MTEGRPLEPTQDAVTLQEPASSIERYLNTSSVVEGMNAALMPFMTPENIDTFRESCIGHIMISSTMGMGRVYFSSITSLKLFLSSRICFWWSDGFVS